MVMRVLISERRRLLIHGFDCGFHLRDILLDYRYLHIGLIYINKVWETPRPLCQKCNSYLLVLH